MTNKQNNRKSEILYFLFATLIFFAFSFNNDFILAPDSYSFLENSISRPMGYSIFLDLFEFLFRENYLITIRIFQLLFLSFSIVYYVSMISKLFELNKTSQILLLVGLIIVNILPALFSDTGILMYNAIVTEGLVYPLLLIIFANMIRAIINSSITLMNKSLPLILLTMMIKSQYTYLLIFFFIAYIYVSIICKKLSLKIIFRAFLIILCVYFINFITLRIYNLYQHGYFVESQLPTSTLTGKLLFLGDIDDINENDFTEYEYNILHKTFEESNRRNLTSNSLDNSIGLFDLYSHYEKNYDIIYHRIYKKYFIENRNELTYNPDDYIELEKFSGDLNKILIRGNLAEYCKLTFVSAIIALIRANSIYLGSQFDYQIYLTAFSLIAYIVSFYLIYIYRSNKKLTRFSFFVYIFLMGNAAPSILVHYPLSRYIIVTLPLFYTMIFLYLIQFHVKFIKNRHKR